ncbi:MAG: ATP-dependent Clp protease ATP-binding subunit [Candidatus Moranbacteria bacterium]|nr:ATP-dependent Clp protease ATP-binding subunit [Candidatus Moranbacteria bacterium]
MFPFSFLIWIYSEGFLSLVSSWENLFRYFLHIFNFRELVPTFFSPWKRDSSPKNWLGLDIGKSLNRFAMNVFSRVMGVIVRSFVLVFGSVSIAFLALFGFGFLVGWLVTVPALFWFFVRSPFGHMKGGEWLFLAFSFVLLLVQLVSFASRQPKSFLPRSRGELFRMKWFPRVLGRLGIAVQDFRASDWTSDEAFRDRLADLNMSDKDFDDIVTYEAFAAERAAKRLQLLSWENLRKTVPFGRGWQFGFTVHLDRYATDISKADFSEYSKLHLFGRDDELRVTTLLLGRPGQNSFVLVGDAGIGKKTFVHALARKIREGDLPGFEQLRFLSFDLSIAVGDAGNRGEDPENFIRSLFYEAANAGNVVLVIENLDSFLNGKSGRIDLSSAFTEFLALPSFRVIGMMSASGYNALAHDDEPTLKFLEAVYLREPGPEDTARILLNVFAPEERNRVIFSWKALQSIVEISGQYEWDIPYPEKAIDLAQETMQNWQVEPDGPYVTPRTVMAFVSLKTGVPIGALGESEKERLLKLEEILHLRVVGQDEAVRQVAEALRRARAGFGNPNRPLGSFLFLGPTGVGKTETAKALAEAYFGDENRMVRLDMSEFQSSDAADRMLGSNVTGEEGRLSGVMKEHPFSVLLLDEIEKAYPKVLDIFLQILDEGFVTDAFGKKINFRKSIIIATSNASSGLIAELVSAGITQDDLRKKLLTDIEQKGTFRTEFLNRFDGIVCFAPLLGGELSQVVQIKLTSLSDRIKKQKNISVAFTEGVAAAIVRQGYEPVFGARSLNRYIEDHIEDVIVRKVIAGEVIEGGSVTIAEADLA